MDSFEVKEICSEGYERWIKVLSLSSNIIYWLHFIEHDEFLENKEITKKLNIGDTIKGKIKIDLVTEYKIIKNISNCDYGFVQSIDGSSSVIATGVVKEIEDSYTVICSINKLGNNIVVEFERKINVEFGQIIEIRGSLELERE
ncbi:hypothetical protein [Paenibacillus sanfengchensis]|uniref:hypothetical protein n=1 Tax=Paenibacillus sanfengchensis TaxID=3119819 RepID=UPI002FE1FD08